MLGSELSSIYNAGMPKLRPYSRPTAYAKIDGRTWQGRLLEESRQDFTRHVGGDPSVVQRHLIERAAMLTLHMAQIDRRTAEGHAMTEHDSRTYLAWSNSLTRTLAHLGLTKADETVPTLSDYLAERAELAGS
jgi:hypothetical protein